MIESSVSQGKLPKGIYPPISNLNPAADPRKMRRIIAEDPEWTLLVVPSLKNLCLDHFVKHFEENPILDELPPSQKTYILERLSTSLPLSLTATLISDEDYWKRCCSARWSLNDISEYGYSWKRMFFERHLEQLIEQFIPEVTAPKTVLELVPLCKNYIQRLKISQFLPPINEPAQIGSDMASNKGNSWPSMDHFDFQILLDKLTNLEELHLVYGVKNCGMNFEWNLFVFTLRDCGFLAKALKSCESLKVLRIHQSKLDDEKCRILVKHLLDHPSLLELDFSHNLIGDRGARAIGKLLKCGHLQSLDIYDNQIRGPGAEALAHSLSNNTTLLSLNMRLNWLGDEGGQAMAKVLLTNRTLLNLHLGANRMTHPTAIAFSQALVQNSTLRNLNLSCNELGMEGGKELEEGISRNSSILECDIRLTGMSLESEKIIRQVLQTNQAKNQRKLI